MHCSRKLHLPFPFGDWPAEERTSWRVTTLCSSSSSAWPPSWALWREIDDDVCTRVCITEPACCWLEELVEVELELTRRWLIIER